MTATLSRQLLAGPLDIELQGRVAAAAAQARALLGDAVEADAPRDRGGGGGGGGRGSGGGRDAAAAPADALRGLIDALTARLSEQSEDAPGAAVHEQEAALERLRHRYDTRFEALAAVRQAIDELRSITSPASMLGQAPAALCGASKLDRVVLSLAEEGRMVAEAAHFTGDRSGAAEVVASAPRRPDRAGASAHRNRAAAPPPRHHRR